MAVVSSHTLNGTDGTHAGCIGVTLRNLTSGVVVFDTAMDDGGRLAQNIDAASIDTGATYEMVFATGSFWDAQNLPRQGARIMDEIVLRFRMPDPNGHYHMPLILSPHGLSMWSSTENG